MEAEQIIGYVTNPNVTWIFIGAIVACILLLMLFRFSFVKWLLWFAIPTLISSLIFIVFGLFGSQVINVLLTNELAQYGAIVSPFIKTLTMNFIMYGVVLLALGIVAIIVHIIVKKKTCVNTPVK